MRILGIDPGYERLGIALIEGSRGKEKLIYSECFKTSATLSFAERLLLIGKKIEALIKTYNPNTLAIENLFLQSNQKTAMRVAEVRGAILYLARARGLVVAEYTPLQIKSAIVGYGKGDKHQVASMVAKLIKVPIRKVLDDEYDAIAIALTASASLR